MRHMKKDENKKRKVSLASIMVVVGLVFIIGGYKFFYPNRVNNPMTNTTKTASVKKAAPIAEKTKESSSVKPTNHNLIWNAKQNDKLKAAVNGNNDNYLGVNEQHTINFQGKDFPSYFQDHKVSVNQQDAKVAWTDKKDNDADYQVVAIYNSQQYLYFFTLHNNQPEVFVTSQVGDELNFVPTQNNQMLSGINDALK